MEKVSFNIYIFALFSLWAPSALAQSSTILEAPSVPPSSALIRMETSTPHVGEQSFLEDSPQFSFRSSQDAFKSARAPTLEELPGKWVLVGETCRPSRHSDGYWPDGKQKAPGWGSGLFQIIVSISKPITDAYGKTILTWTHKLVGAESGKVYYTRGPFTGFIASSGFQFERASGNTFVEECRIVQSSGMLLCTGSDSNETCFSGLTRTF